ncbi:MAG: hypothetical protein PHI40_01915 [Caldisericia bacterium]|nr:hypothetical protein [Caldisericia bacterium]MDD4614149.1 hypothetical protein [Caldisericia bacterium]
MKISSGVFLKWILMIVLAFSLPLSGKRVVIKKGYEEHYFLTYYRNLSSFYHNTDIVKEFVKKTPISQILHDGFVWVIEPDDIDDET